LLSDIKKIEIIRLIVVVGFACSVIFHYVAGMYHGHGYPYSTFLFMPNDRFNDFFNIYKATMHLNPYTESVSVYLPFTYLPIYIFTFLKPYIAYLFFFLLFFSFLIVAAIKYLPSENLTNRLLTFFSLFVVSYPILFTLDRGNLECFVFIFLGLFIYCYNTRKVFFEALFLACAIAMKIYPAVFMILFLADRRWKPMFLTVAFTGILTVVSAGLLSGGIWTSLAGLQKNLMAFNTQYINSIHGLQHNSSIYVPVKLIAVKLGYVKMISVCYPVLAILVFLFASVHIIFREQEFWKKIAILSFMMIILPQVSYDYKLIHIFLPLLLFFTAKAQSNFDWFYSVAFALLIIPKDYYYLFSSDISINGIINAILLLIFVCLIVLDRRKEVMS